MTKMKRHILYWLLALLPILACKKNNTGSTPPVRTPDYGDSVFYPRGGNTDYTISPLHPGTGQYFGFPDGIIIDKNTGVINISKSETGLRYRISFLPDGSADTVSTMITISGINYLDGFYLLSGDDSILHPIYNGLPATVLPGIGTGSLFDEGALCNNSGCIVNTANGDINLAATVRSQVFGNIPANNARQEFQLNYRLQDQSGNASNSLRVKIYYFDTMADVTNEAFDILTARQGTVIGVPPHNVPAVIPAGNGSKQPSRPRPPCIFIVGR